MKQRVMAYARAFGVVSAMSVLAAGATYAALGSSVELTSTTLSSASADLQIFDGSTFADTAPGFTVTGLVPGVESAPYPFYFKNTGQLPLNLSAKVEAPYVFNGFKSTSATTNGNAVTVKITDNNGGETVDTTLQALRASAGVSLPGNSLAVNAQGNSGVLQTEGNFSVTFTIDPAAVGGESAGVGAFNVKFTGVQATP